MNTIYIIASEPLETRYTSEWFEELPKIIRKKIKRFDADYNVVQVDGFGSNYKSDATSPGAFLDFVSTNIWKNNQINSICKLFNDKKIKPYDKFLFADAWNTGVIQLRYISELTDIPIEIHSIFHAGSYDPQDFLGRKVKDKRWSFNFERGIYFASDFNYFATQFHGKMILDNLEMHEPGVMPKMIRSGLPFEYLKNRLNSYLDIPKENVILFPHRLAAEKQVNIFEDLAKELPEYEFIICQKTNLTKDEYHTLLGKAKIVFSANLQETLGIATYEGLVVNCLPLVPDRLSYSEMYSELFKYPSEWTESWSSYLVNKELLIARIKFMMTNYETFVDKLQTVSTKLNTSYFSSDIMLDNLVTDNNNK